MGNQDFPAAAPKEFPEYAFSISVILSVQESRDNRRPAQHTIPFCGIEVVFYPGEKKAPRRPIEAEILLRLPYAK